MVIRWFNRHRRTGESKIRPLYSEIWRENNLFGRTWFISDRGGWCTTTGSSVVQVTIERRDKSEGSERSASVQSVPGKRIIDFTGISISAGIVRAIRHTRGGFCFFMRAVRGDLRENIALTMAFWRAWHARLGEGRVWKQGHVEKW